MATFNPARTTAEQYIREYLDPSNTFSAEPMTEDEAFDQWAALEDTFASDGGTGIDRLAFVKGVGAIQRAAGFPGW